jgi:hypothetical protein
LSTQHPTPPACSGKRQTARRGPSRHCLRPAPHSQIPSHNVPAARLTQAEAATAWWSQRGALHPISRSGRALITTLSFPAHFATAPYLSESWGLPGPAHELDIK